MSSTYSALRQYIPGRAEVVEHGRNKKDVEYSVHLFVPPVGCSIS